MDQVGAYDLQLANRLIEDYKDKAADIIARLLNRDEKIRADVHQLFVLNPRNGPQSPCAPPGLLNTEAPATHRSSSLHSGSPPPHPQHGARRGISTDSIPMSPPRTASSLGSRSARGGSSTREYILVPYHTGSEVKERIIQMNTAAIQSSVIRADLVSRIGLDVDREEGFVQLPHPTEPNSWIPLQTAESVTLDWRRPNSQATHSTTFLLVPKNLLDTDALLGLADSGDGHSDESTVQPQTRHECVVPPFQHSSQSPAPNAPSHSYHASHIDPNFPHQQGRSRTDEKISHQDSHDPAARPPRDPQQSPASTMIGPSLYHSAHSLPYRSSVHYAPAPGGVHGDPNRRLRAELKWGVTVVKVWLDLDNHAEGFFLAFQQQASKRRTMPDRSSMTIHFKTEQNAPDDAAYSLTLDQEDLDADWGEAVLWLEKNKRELSPHIYGRVVVGGD